MTSKSQALVKSVHMTPKGTFALDPQLRDKVSSVFDQAQTTTANHRKNCTILYKCQLDATLTAQRGRKAKTTINSNNNKDLFSDTFLDLVNRVLTIKKGTPNATRVVLFIIAYVKFALQKGRVSVLFIIMDKETQITSLSRLWAHARAFSPPCLPATSARRKFRLLSPRDAFGSPFNARL